MSNKLAKFVIQDAKKLWITGDIREISQCKVSDAQVTVKARGHFDLLMEIKHKSWKHYIYVCMAQHLLMSLSQC